MALGTGSGGSDTTGAVCVVKVGLARGSSVVTGKDAGGMESGGRVAGGSGAALFGTLIDGAAERAPIVGARGVGFESGAGAAGEVAGATGEVTGATSGLRSDGFPAVHPQAIHMPAASAC